MKKESSHHPEGVCISRNRKIRLPSVAVALFAKARQKIHATLTRRSGYSASASLIGGAGW